MEDLNTPKSATLSKEEAEVMIPTARIARNALSTVAGSTQRTTGRDPAHPSPSEHKLGIWNTIIQKLNAIIHE